MFSPQSMLANKSWSKKEGLVPLLSWKNKLVAIDCADDWCFFIANKLLYMAEFLQQQSF